MSSRLDKSWVVLASHQTDEANRCVDIVSRPDGTYGFEVFRRDPEEMGAWIPVSLGTRRVRPNQITTISATKNGISSILSTSNGTTSTSAKLFASASGSGATPTTVRIANLTYALRRPTGTRLPRANLQKSAAVLDPSISTMTILPPGLTTRTHSATAALGSGQCFHAHDEIKVSKVSTGNGKDSARDRTANVAPRFGERWLSRRTCDIDGSTPNTSTPQEPAIDVAIRPPPHPTSRTRCPTTIGRMTGTTTFASAGAIVAS